MIINGYATGFLRAVWVVHNTHPDIVNSDRAASYVHVHNDALKNGVSKTGLIRISYGCPELCLLGGLQNMLVSVGRAFLRVDVSNEYTTHVMR